MTTQNSTADADRALKAKHRAMWAQGDYPSVASEVIPQLGAVLVEACDVRPGQRVLDVGAYPGTQRSRRPSRARTSSPAT